MLPNADAIEITWTTIAGLGVIVAAVASAPAWADCRAARRFGDPEHIVKAWHNARREIVRLIGQAINTVPGVFLMTLPSSDATPAPMRLLIILSLSFGSACVTINTAWDLLSRYVQARRYTFAPDTEMSRRMDDLTAAVERSNVGIQKAADDRVIESADRRLVKETLGVAQRAVDVIKEDADAARGRADAVHPNSDPGVAADAASQSEQAREDDPSS